MARLVKKASKKTVKRVAPAPKAAKAPVRKKTTASAKAAPAKKAAAKKANQKPSGKAKTKAGKVASKASTKQAPTKKAAKRVTSSKKAVARRKATEPSAPKKPVRRASKVRAAAPRPVPPPRPAKLSPAQIEELRIAKERRKAQERQADFYDKASRAFQARHFQRALTLFEKAADGPDSTLTDRARIHVSICERQVKPRKVKLKSADEYYHYGIRLINERRLDEAEKSLNQALKLQPRGAHIHFAAAILAALTRDLAGTYKSLKRAIELDPRNRISALNDTDLAVAARDPAISQLLHGNSAPSGGR